MITITKARALRKLIETASASLTDTDALNGVELFPRWNDSKAYEQNDRVSYQDTLYKCLQSHTAQADWNPKDAVSLWVRVDDPSIEFPEWHQPTGSHDAYNKGDKVSHLGKHWQSNVDGNVWEPPTMWDEV